MLYIVHSTSLSSTVGRAFALGAVDPGSILGCGLRLYKMELEREIFCPLMFSKQDSQY